MVSSCHPDVHSFIIVKKGQGDELKMKKITLIATGLVAVAIGTYLIAGNAQREEADTQGV